MIETLGNWDTWLFLAINGAWPALDNVMWWVSEPLFWLPLYVAMVWACKTVLGTWKQRLVVAMCVGLCVCKGAGEDIWELVQRLPPSS